MKEFLRRFCPSADRIEGALSKLGEGVKTSNQGDGAFFACELSKEKKEGFRLGDRIPQIEAELRAWGAQWAKVEVIPGRRDPRLPDVVMTSKIRVSAVFLDSPERLKQRIMGELPALHPDPAALEAVNRSKQQKEKQEKSATFVAKAIALAQQEGIILSDFELCCLGLSSVNWKSTEAVLDRIRTSGYGRAKKD